MSFVLRSLISFAQVLAPVRRARMAVRARPAPRDRFAPPVRKRSPRLIVHWVWFRLIAYFFTGCSFVFPCRRHVAAAVSARICLQRVVPGAARPVSRRVRNAKQRCPFASPCLTISPRVYRALCSSFGNTTGLVACVPCGAGTFNALTGQSSVAACQACGVGTFSNVTGQSACLACGIGTFNSLPGQSTCLACGIAGSYPTSALSGQPLTCLPCPAGAFCPDGATPPLPCPIGFACPGLGLSFPQLCGGGSSFCPVSNLTSPLPCPSGNMSTPGATVCVAAVVSTFAGSGNQSLADGAGTAAVFNGPQGVAVDASGNVLVGDSSNQRVRFVTPSGGTRPTMR